MTPILNTPGEEKLLEEALTPEQESIKKEQENDKNDLFDFAKAKTRLQQLKSSWDYQFQETLRRRLLRNVDISPEALRVSGKLLPDETIVPMRVIDTNIKREQPAYINFLKGTNRLAVFQCISDSTQDTQQIESEFSRVMTYNGWERPHYKCLDGSQTHGWDSIEVVADDTLPGTLGLEHVGHDKLLFNLESVDFQANEVVLRVYSFSLLQLKKAHKLHGFSEQEVKKLSDKMTTGVANVGPNMAGSQASPKDRNCLVYKKYCKYEGKVWVSWFSFECDDWLKAPAPFYIGRKEYVQVMVPREVPNPAYQQALASAASPSQQISNSVNPPLGMGIKGNSENTTIPTPVLPPPTITIQQPEMQWQDAVETIYPIFLLPYQETEEQEIVAHKGRVFLDAFKQEALTSICSGYINGLNRASNIYGSVDNPPDGTTAAPKQLDTKLGSGSIYDRKVNFWHTEYPDPSVLQGMQWLDTYNSQEVGQLNFAANNRQDSRKTATEIGVANQQQAALSSVQVSLYSMFLREIYSFVWPIIQTRALAGLIKFLQVPSQPTIDMLTGQPKQTFTNDISRIEMEYNVKAAGDTDVIQRSEMLMRMKNDWPIYAPTPLAMEFLKEMINLSYPTMANKWLPLLDQMDPRQMLAQLAAVLQGILKDNPEAIAKMKPEVKQQVGELLQQAQTISAPPEQQKQQTANTQ